MAVGNEVYRRVHADEPVYTGMPYVPDRQNMLKESKLQ